MNKLIDYFAARTKLANIITIVITVVGLISLFYMKKDLHPAFKFNYITVSLSYPNASAEEIERLITYPLEESLRNVSDVEEISSSTQSGIVRITLKFPESIKNLSEKIEETRTAANLQMRLLPQQIRDFQVTQLTDNRIFLANLAVTGLEYKNRSHHEFVKKISNQFRSIEGVANVESSLKPFHIFIKFDRDILKQKQVTIAQIRSAIRNELQSNAISYNSLSGKNWLLEYSPSEVDLEKIKKIQLRNNGFGNRLAIGDVAEVRYDQTKGELYQFLVNGVEATEITVFKNEKSDSIETFELLKKELSGIKTPDGVTVQILYDGPYFIKQQINVLLSNGLGGLVLVLVILALVMGWRTSLMTAIGLPISYFGTFFILKLLGISIDLISLIAMILVVGNLVDDAVIFAEKYNQLLSEGVDPKKAATDSAKELIVPVTGTILTIIFAFIPIVALSSELSQIFFAIPVVVAVSLLLSWFETFFILPNHLHNFVKKPTAERATEFFYKLAQKYKMILIHTLKYRYLYGVASVGLLIFSLMTAAKMPQNFNLSINAPQVEIAVFFQDEYSFEKVNTLLQPLHAKVLALPKEELDFVETHLGWLRRDGKSYRGAKYATIRLVLSKFEVDTKSLRDTVEKQVKVIVDDLKIPEVKEFVVIAGERGSNDRVMNTSSIQISGRDEFNFSKARSDLVTLVQEKQKKLEYVKPENDGPETFRFNLNEKSLADMGFSRNELSEQIQSLTGPSEIVEARSGNEWMTVYLEPAQYIIPDINHLNKLKIQPYQEGPFVDISKLGQWETAGFAEKIEHRKGERILKIDFRYDGKETNEQVVKKELSEIILPVSDKYKNLKIEVVDSNEQDKKGREWGLKVMLFSFLSIYIILAFTLGSFTQPFIVGLPIPFALIGVIWALKLHQMPMGLMVMIGLIGTMGVAVNDSIVMVHQINLLWRKYGVESAELIVEAAASRLRAIILTASCTLIGVFPTAYGLGGESGFTQPLAFAMGWGLSASLMLTLFIIPAMMMVLKDTEKLFKKVKTFFNQPKKSIDKMQATNTQIDLQN